MCGAYAPSAQRGLELSIWMENDCLTRMESEYPNQYMLKADCLLLTTVVIMSMFRVLMTALPNILSMIRTPIGYRVKQCLKMLLIFHQSFERSFWHHLMLRQVSSLGLTRTAEPYICDQIVFTGNRPQTRSGKTKEFDVRDCCLSQFRRIEFRHK